MQHHQCIYRYFFYQVQIYFFIFFGISWNNLCYALGWLEVIRSFFTWNELWCYSCGPSLGRVFYVWYSIFFLMLKLSIWSDIRHDFSRPGQTGSDFWSLDDLKRLKIPEISATPCAFTYIYIWFCLFLLIYSTLFHPPFFFKRKPLIHHLILYRSFIFIWAGSGGCYRERKSHLEDARELLDQWYVGQGCILKKKKKIHFLWLAK